ncbi:MAG: hypothetical protein C0469_15125 [Cyanobacteria bacterium DS2.3.42]|nr:hypothetical protein [Cyanobacteria bacterium DS2.3.42]
MTAETFSPPRVATPERSGETSEKLKTADIAPLQADANLADPANVPAETPNTAGGFLQHLEIHGDNSAAQNAESRIAIPTEGADAHGQNLITQLQRSAQSEILGAPYDRTKVAQAVTAMTDVDSQRYQNEPDFRMQIQKYVDSLDAPTKNYVNALLNQVMDTGKPPRIGTAETVLANSMNHVDAQTAMPTIERLLTQNPELRQRLNSTDAANLSPQERALKEAINDSMNRVLFEVYGARVQSGRDASPAERAMAVKNLWESGSLPLDVKAQAGMKTNSFYEQASQASQQEIQGLVQSGRISEQERALIEKIATQDGRMSIEDRVRAFIVGGNIDLADIRRDLRQLSPLAMQEMRREYFKQYGVPVQTDFNRRLDVSARNENAELFEYDRAAATREEWHGRWKR